MGMSKSEGGGDGRIDPESSSVELQEKFGEKSSALSDEEMATFPSERMSGRKGKK